MSLFGWLFKKKPEVPEPPPEFLAANPPDWVIELTGQGLPHGRRFSVRAQITNATRLATADVVVFENAAAGEPSVKTVTLERTVGDRLLVLLGFSFPDDIADVASTVKDGCPVEISVYRREPMECARARCNLAGWLDTRKSLPPAAEIGKLLAGLVDSAG